MMKMDVPAWRRWLLALCLLCLPVQLFAAAMAETPRLRRFGIAEGLPSRMVVALAQDRRGYLWAGTDDGLARYDGKEFKVWRHEPDDPASLPANSVETLLIDPLDRIWVGSNGGGVGLLDAQRSGFRRFEALESRCTAQAWGLAYAAGSLWVGSSGTGVCRRDEDGRVRQYRAEPGNPHGLPDDTVYSMLSDARDRVWIGTAAGLARWDGEAAGFTRIGPQVLGGKAIIRMSRDPDGRIWVGTFDGLYQVGEDDVVRPAPWPQAADARAAVLLHDRNGGYWMGTGYGLYRGDEAQLGLLDGDRGDGFLTSRSGVLDLLQDHEGGVWMAMLTQGLVYLRPDWKRFATWYQVDGQPLESMYLLNTAADGDGFLVVGANGLYRLDGNGKLAQLAGEQRLGKGSIWSVLRGDDGMIWLGRAGKLGLYDEASKQLRVLDLGVGDDPQLRADLMRKAADGSVWLSIINHGLQHRAADGRLLADLPGGSHGLPPKLVEQIRFDPSGTLWAVGEGGVFRQQGDGFVSLGGLERGTVYDIVFAADGTLWLARDGALEHYRRDGDGLSLLRRIGSAEGVPAVAMGGLVLGREGQLWATTPRGLLLWQPDTEVLRMVGEDSGLPDTEFTSRPPAWDGKHRALAVSATGLVGFDPDETGQALPPSQLVNEALHVRGKREEREEALPVTEVVRLGPNDRDLRVTARLLSYVDPQRHRFRFRAEGYDQGWVEQDGDGTRVLPRLPAGSYLLDFQGQVPGGSWSAPRQLRIEVAPPWWRSNLAWFVYAVIAVLAFGTAVQAYRARMRRRSEWALAEQRRELAEQASLAKTRFLATLGHEVRTPMTGVLGMTELLLDSPLDATQRSHANSIQAAGNHLLRLVNDALDLARIEAGRLELVQEPFELGPLLDQVSALIAPVAHKRGLDFVRAKRLPMPVTVSGDSMRLRQILMNLLGNAVKFTEHGHVGLDVELQQDGRGLRLEVSDTGPGINAEQQSRLFQRFEQADGPRTASRYGGSGLGLAICQELAMAMGGRISIDSRLGEGARFIVELPLHWQAQAASTVAAVAEVDADMPASGLRILLVEDDPTVAEVIAGLLRARGHQVTHALHGLAALAAMATEQFELGLFDLDLPALDGMALARQLRGMGHQLPLVAVTARADADAEQLARAAGFDGFLRKPVSGQMLAEAIAAARRQAMAAA